MADTQDDLPSLALLSAGLEAVPQKIFSKADRFFLQAAELDEQANELAQRLRETQSRADDCRATGYDLQRLATQDRAQIQAEMESILRDLTDVFPAYYRIEHNADKVDDLVSAAEEGTTTIRSVLTLKDELLELRKTINPISSECTISSPVKATRKRCRKSSMSESSASDDFDSIDQLQTSLQKKWKLDLEARKQSAEDAPPAVQVEQTLGESYDELPDIAVKELEPAADPGKALDNISPSGKKSENESHAAKNDATVKDTHTAKNGREKGSSHAAINTLKGKGNALESSAKSKTAAAASIQAQGGEPKMSEKQLRKQRKKRQKERLRQSPQSG